MTVIQRSLEYGDLGVSTTLPEDVSQVEAFLILEQRAVGALAVQWGMEEKNFSQTNPQTYLAVVLAAARQAYSTAA